MSKHSVYISMQQAAIEQKKQLALLLDPDKYNSNHFNRLVNHINFKYFDYILIGGSFLSTVAEECISEIKKLCSKPVITFPGHASHISMHSDAILLLSLISGRNPEFLIGNHVIAAPFLKQSGLEIISTAYMLVGSNGNSSVQYISNTLPIPDDKADIAVATALAGEMIGMKLIYLEAGSGSEKSVPNPLIKAVRNACSIPIIVGGGLVNINCIREKFDAGADIVVIGSALENNIELMEQLGCLS